MKNDKNANELDAPSVSCRDMIGPYLIKHGYDGLYCDECGCTIDDLMPCCGDWAIDCMAGYKGPCDCGEKHDFHIGAVRS